MKVKREEELIPLGDFCAEEIHSSCFEVLDEEERIIFIRNMVDESLRDLFSPFIRWAKEDAKMDETEERVPVKVLIYSLGGDLYAARSLFDLMHSLPLEFITINVGNCFSAAFYIFMAGDCRYTMPNGAFLIHDGTVTSDGVACKAMSALNFIKDLDSRINSELATRSHLSVPMIETKGPLDWYFFSDEALDLGVTHEQIDNLVEVLYPYN